MKERQREVVDPLQVVDKGERRPDHGQRPMCGLENANRLERRRVLLRTEHKRLENVSVRSNTRQCSQEIGSRCERHLGLR